MAYSCLRLTLCAAFLACLWRQTRARNKVHPPSGNAVGHTTGSPRLMYAIVKTGGKQYKVAEGDVIEVEKLAGQAGDELTLQAVLLVDGDDLVTDAAKLAKVAVTAERGAHTKGPKIR